MKLLRLLVLCLLVGLVAPVAASGQDLQSVRAERARLQERLDAAAERLGELEASVAELSEEQAGLSSRVGGLEAEVAAASARIADRVRALYMRGDTHPMIALLGGTDPQDAVARAEFMQRLVSTDSRDAEAASVARVQLQVVLDRLAEKQAAIDAALEEQEEVAANLQRDLEAAQKLEAKLEAEERARLEAERRKRAEEERRRREAAAARQRQSAPSSSTPTSSTPTSTAPPPSGSGGMVCPVDRPRSFTDTWGAPRSGGRRHQGTDILAPRGQTVRAIVGGVWDIRSYGASAGNWAILRGGDGNHYYYMHLERHVVGDGARVSAGQQVATNGDTGNARGTPHVHFEYHPGGGSAVNPYPTLKRICG